MLKSLATVRLTNSRTSDTLKPAVFPLELIDSVFSQPVFTMTDHIPLLRLESKS